MFTNADLLIQMPYGILVVSLLTALMPRLSRAAARDDSTTRCSPTSGWAPGSPRWRCCR